MNDSSLRTGHAARPALEAGLLALAERCEREEPSAALDHAIWSATKLTDGTKWVYYTTSLDAAVTLVPSEHADHWGAHRVGPDCIGTVGNTEAGGKTPALALCAAALRARAAIATDPPTTEGRG